MKKIKLVVTALSIIMLLTAMVGCAPSKNDTPAQPSETQSAGESAEASAPATEPVEIRIYQSKYEIDEALKAACAQYTELNPNVTFVVESSSSGDFQTELKAMFSGGTAPDIFSTMGNVDMALMTDYMEDLSNESWVGNMSAPALESGSYEGKVYGFPLAVEGHGYLYHKNMFEQAGITELPKTYSELKAACEKLVAAGFTPFSGNYSEWYQAAMFELNSPIARQSDPRVFIDAMNAGTESIVGNQAFIDFAQLVALEVEYSKSPLNTDFNTQVSDFASGETAMMIGGSWSQPAMDEVDPNMDLGMFPIPMGEDAAANDKFYASSAPFWSINNESASVDECKKFLEWLATTPEGQKNLTSGFKLIPGFMNLEADESAIGPTGSVLKQYIDEGKTYGIYNSYYPNGFGGAQVFGETITKYAAGKLTADELLTELQSAWESQN